MFVTESAPTTLLSAMLAKPIETRSAMTLTSTSLWNSQLPFVDPDLIAHLNQQQSNRNKDVQKSLPKNSRCLDWKLEQPNSTSTIISTDAKSVCFHAKCSSCFETEAVRVDKPINPNCVTHMEWRVDANTTGGTSVMFGVCSEKSRLHWAHGYVDLLGNDDFSWALSSRGHLHHNGLATSYCDAFDDCREHTIRCTVNSITGSIHFWVDGVYKGKAFESKSIGKVKLYACVASTVARSVFRLGCVVEAYASLQDLCSLRVRDDARCVRQAFDEYRLPRSMIFGSYS